VSGPPTDSVSDSIGHSLRSADGSQPPGEPKFHAKALGRVDVVHQSSPSDRRPDDADRRDESHLAAPRLSSLVHLLGQRLSTPRVLLGVLIGGFALWLAFRGFALKDLAAAIRRLHSTLTALAFLSTGVTLLLLTLRWRLLFHPLHRDMRLAPLFKAIIVGQMVNILSPLRVGEIARVYTLADDAGLSKTHVLATLAVEKVLDLIVFGLAIALLIGVMALPEGVRVRTSAQLGVGATALGLLWLAARFALPAARALEQRLPPLPPRVRTAARATLHRFVDGLTTLRRPDVGAALLAQSVAVLFCSALTNYLLILAFGFDVPVWGALFLLVLLQVGAVPPSLPGKLGVFNYLVVVGLGAFGVPRADALSYSIVLYGVALLPKVLLGTAFLAATPVRPRPDPPTV
jgi:uncharacterized protein (TIRG00374 family)